MIEIDGSYGEGGGQIMRSSLTLSALTGQPLHIHHIRANRRQPGLRTQHLAALDAMTELSQAEVDGAKIHSQEVIFRPRQNRTGRYRFDIHTAGALSLVLQTIFLPLSFTEGRSQITLTGGTHVQWSPVFHYLSEQWLPIIQQLGYRLELELVQAGFYPRGGGEVHVKILPAQALRPFTCLDRGELLGIRGLSGVANLADEIAKRQKHQALRRLYAICKESKIKTIRLPSPVKGTFVLLKALFSKCGSACYTALGAPGKPAERVADEAVDPLLSFLKTEATVDHFLADQLLLPLAMVEGTSQFRTNAVTQHLRTNAHIIQTFLDVPIKIEGDIDQPGEVKIEGLDKKSWMNFQ